jgi:hypothetical protein
MCAISRPFRRFSARNTTRPATFAWQRALPRRNGRFRAVSSQIVRRGTPVEPVEPPQRQAAGENGVCVKGATIFGTCRRWFTVQSAATVRASGICGEKSPSALHSGARRGALVDRGPGRRQGRQLRGHMLHGAASDAQSDGDACDVTPLGQTRRRACARGATPGWQTPLGTDPLIAHVLWRRWLRSRQIQSFMFIRNCSYFAPALSHPELSPILV